MLIKHLIEKKFYYLGVELIQEILEVSEVITFPSGTELVKEGQYIKVIPVVLQGLVKVFTTIEDKELLLYYIRPEQSCIMSFSSSLSNEQSRFQAITEEESTVMLIPSDKVVKWVIAAPAINLLFYRQYELRYAELIKTINRLIYDKLDKRLMDYLVEKVGVTGKNLLKISHKEIARDLGTAREVISRILKKLESDGKIKLSLNTVEIPGL